MLTLPPHPLCTSLLLQRTGQQRTLLLTLPPHPLCTSLLLLPLLQHWGRSVSGLGICGGGRSSGRAVIMAVAQQSRRILAAKVSA